MSAKPKRIHLAALTIVASAALGLIAAAPAQATTPTPPQPAPSQGPAPSSSGSTADTSIPAVQAEIARIKTAGGTILSSQTVPFKPKRATTSAVTPMALPSGCGLSVIIYKSGSRIYSSSLTSCPGSYISAYMDSTMDKFDTFWGIWAGPVASKNTTSFGTSSFTDTYYYACPNGNQSGFRTTTDGGMNYGGTDYYADAYDVTGYEACG
jgi:hypothetical protein